MDMEYMNRLDDVAGDAVALIREKTETYGDSWKRRGGPGAWFTTVRPIDRLEGIMSRHGGDIFAAIEAQPDGPDGSALACVRDIMNYCILIEAHARARLGVEGHTRSEEVRKAPFCLCPEGALGVHQAGCVYYIGMRPCTVEYIMPPGTPEDGGHHARHPLCEGLEDAGEVTQDTQGAGDSRVATVSDVPVVPAPGLEESIFQSRMGRLESFLRDMRGRVDFYGLHGAVNFIEDYRKLGAITIEIDLRKIG